MSAVEHADEPGRQVTAARAGRVPRARLALVLALAASCLASAVAVAWVRHVDRTLFVELQALERARDRMNVEWGQLQLEQSTWASHERILGVARERLDMRVPAPGQVTVVRP